MNFTESEKKEIDREIDLFISELKPIVQVYRTKMNLKDKQISFMISYKFGLNEISFKNMPNCINSVSQLQTFLNVALKARRL